MNDLPAHTCPDGQRRLGDDLDCPHCRAGLLEAFRTEPPSRRAHSTAQSLIDMAKSLLNDPPKPLPVANHRIDMGIRPNGLFGMDHWYILCSCGHREEGTIADHDIAQAEADAAATRHMLSLSEVTGHAVQVRVQDGYWGVRCACGWNLDGTYPPSEEGIIRITVQSMAEEHVREES